MGFAHDLAHSPAEFTIGSTHARLVEVTGNGPYVDRPGGLVIGPAVDVTSPVSLLNDFIRSFRVDAPETVQTKVRVSRSPFGVFVGVRRCVGRAADWRWTLRRFAGRLLSVRDLLAEQQSVSWRASLPHLLAPCEWMDVVPNDGDEVTARGGDVVVVSFVVP